MMILGSISPVISDLHHVTIDQDEIQRASARLDAASLSLPTWDDEVFLTHPPDTRAAQILLFNTINFSYWGDPKWTIDFDGRPQDGAWGMLGAISRAVRGGFPLFDGAYLASISASDLRHVLRGNVEIPMFRERLDILHEVGAVLVAEFGGSLIDLIRAAGGDGMALVNLLVTRFPSFNDVASLGEAEVAFYKRAQLATAMLYEAFRGQGLGDLCRVEALTVFADYKLPQVLRRLGVLRYDSRLAHRIDRREPLEAGSREEVEIRAATVWAAELMRRRLVSDWPWVTGLHIDYWLWLQGQIKGPDIRPYHRTRSIYY